MTPCCLGTSPQHTQGGSTQVAGSGCQGYLNPRHASHHTPLQTRACRAGCAGADGARRVHGGALLRGQPAAGQGAAGLGPPGAGRARPPGRRHQVGACLCFNCRIAGLGGTGAAWRRTRAPTWPPPSGLHLPSSSGFWGHGDRWDRGRLAPHARAHLAAAIRSAPAPLSRCTDGVRREGSSLIAPVTLLILCYTILEGLSALGHCAPVLLASG